MGRKEDTNTHAREEKGRPMGAKVIERSYIQLTNFFGTFPQMIRVYKLSKKPSTMILNLFLSLMTAKCQRV